MIKFAKLLMHSLLLSGWMEQGILETNAGKQLSQADTYV
jgi:hypothetical protein